MFPDLFVRLGGSGSVAKCVGVLERNAVHQFCLDGLDRGEMSAERGLVLVLVLVLVVSKLFAERVVQHVGDIPTGHGCVVCLVSGRQLREFRQLPHMFCAAVMGSDAGVFLADAHPLGILEKARLTISFLTTFHGSVGKNTYLRSAVVGDGCDGCVVSGH